MSIFQYSWFIAIAAGIAFSSLFNRSSDETLKAKGLDRLDVNKAYTTVSIGMATTAGLLGINQVMAGIENPFYLYSQNFDNPHVLISKVVLTVFWCSFAAWIWLSTQYHTYAQLALPKALGFLERPSKFILSAVIVFGLVMLYFYPGNQLPFLVINLSDESIEWIEVSSTDGSETIGPIKPRSQTVETLSIGQDDNYTVKYKLLDKSAMGAQFPFTISEFSAGMVQIVFGADGQLKIIDRRLFK